MKKKIIGLLLFCLLLGSFGGTAAAAVHRSPYSISVNLTQNIVTVYERDENGKYTTPVKAFRCSVGDETPEGIFRTQAKYEWRPLFGDVWGQYATRITGHILFHSVPYLERDKGALQFEEFNKLGETASAGCVRLSAGDAKWIYDHCPVGTVVKMYCSETQEPLMPEEMPQIDPEDYLRRGWDPTDPDENNPWKNIQLHNIQVQSAKGTCEIGVYFKDGQYFMTAESVQQLYELFGVTGLAEMITFSLAEG